MEKDDIKNGLETAGYVFNPMISYEGDFSLNLPVVNSDDEEFVSYDYSLDNDILFLNSKIVDGKNMYEEFIHTIQRVLYTSEERKSGKLNIEFEAKLIIDFLNMIKGGYCGTDLNCIQGRNVNGIG